MKRPAWIGADPGMSGAIALYLPDASTLDSCEPVDLKIEDMPYIKAAGEKSEFDHWRLAAILGAWVSLYDVRGVTIEKVHSMPKQGVTSSFSFGGSFGAIKQAVASAGLRFTLIPPATWKAIYGLRGGRENKDMSRAKATSLFPRQSALWQRKKDDGRAEAALLAHYGSKLQ